SSCRLQSERAVSSGAIVQNADPPPPGTRFALVSNPPVASTAGSSTKLPTRTPVGTNGSSSGATGWRIADVIVGGGLVSSVGPIGGRRSSGGPGAAVSGGGPERGM